VAAEEEAQDHKPAEEKLAMNASDLITSINNATGLVIKLAIAIEDTQWEERSNHHGLTRGASRGPEANR
jgi:hypothetical protein